MEIGARGREGETQWSAALYRTDLSDDIQFVSSGGAINAGYFQNVGKTRRQGVELAVGSSWGPVAIVARYSAIAATYRTPFVEHSPANSSADAAGDITVRAGDRSRASCAGAARAAGRQRRRQALAWRRLAGEQRHRLRGDENNRTCTASPGYVCSISTAAGGWQGTSRCSPHQQRFRSPIQQLRRPGQQRLCQPGAHFRSGNRSPSPSSASGRRGAWLGVR
jgi:hypothetical protein